MGRHNGHEALSYVALIDLDPPIADVLLDVFGEEGIAAYVAPALRRSATAIVAPRIDRPLDRVYVDAGALAQARELLRRQLPTLQADHEAPWPPAFGGSAPVPDQAWASVLASYALPSDDTHRPWPAREDLELDLDLDAQSEPGRKAGPDPGPVRRRGRLLRRTGDTPRSADTSPLPDWAWEPARSRRGRDAVGSDLDGDHFVPPPPPPLPATDLPTRLSWGALLGGPLVLLLGALLDWDLGGWLGLVGALAFAGGFISLVARMRDAGPDDFDPDDGAVV